MPMSSASSTSCPLSPALSASASTERMTAHGSVSVVEIERMCRGPIYQRRRQPRRALHHPDESGFGRSFGLDDLIDEDLRQRFTRSGNCDAEEIEEAVACDLARILRRLVPSQVANRADQTEGGIESEIFRRF